MVFPDLATEMLPKEIEMMHVRARTSVWAALLAVVALLALGSASALAQDATPPPLTPPAHPVHIHSGSCDALGDVVYPLNDITLYSATNAFSFGPVGTPEASAMATPATPLPEITITKATPVLFSLTHIDADITEFIGGGYAINAHESAANIQNYIACGDIPPCTGIACAAVTGVTVQLAPQNNSGYFGVARIEAAPKGGSNVSVFLFDLPMAS
jgi:hypothetical protein